MKRRLLPAAFCALVLLTGCISSERMVRNSPMGRERGIEVRFDSDTVNLWPLFFRDPAGMNILWPLYDRDSNGFAVRPFYVNEGNEHSFLWPLSGWNSNEGWALNAFWDRREGSGGVFPLYYQNQETLWLLPFLKRFAGAEWYERQGILPLYYYKNPNRWFFGPAWRAEEWHGIFPLYWKFPDDCLAGPVWWNQKGEFSVFPLMKWRDDYKRVLLGWKKGDSCGVFPVYWQYPDFTLAGPVWWSKDARGVFPVYWQYPDFTLAGPAWWSKESYGFFPLLWSYPDFSMAGPVWWKEGAGGFFPVVWLDKKGTNIVGPVWWSKEGGGFFPLLNFSPEISNAGPVWWSGKGGGVFPLAGVEGDSGHVLLYWWKENGSSGVFPFAYRRKDEYRDHLQVLGPVAGYDIREQYRANHFLYPLWRYSWRQDCGSSWMVWPLVCRDGGMMGDAFLRSPILQINEHRAAPGVPDQYYTPFGSGFSHEKMLPSRVLKHRKSYFLCGLGFQENGTARVWKTDKDVEAMTRLGDLLDRFPRSKEEDTLRQSWSGRLAKSMKELALIDPVPASKEEAGALLEKLAVDYCSETDYAEHRTLGGLGSWYERFGDEHWGHFFFGLVMTRKYEDKSDFRILGYLYREKHDGEASEYLIPPFISVKRSPERNSWSFLYRLWHYENDNGKKSGSIFFIPWGD